MTDDEGNEWFFVRHRGKLSVVMNDTLYEVTRWLRDGAAALLAGVPYWACPHRNGSQRTVDWESGHELAQIDELGRALAGSAVDQLAVLTEVEDWDA